MAESKGIGSSTLIAVVAVASAAAFAAGRSTSPAPVATPEPMHEPAPREAPHASGPMRPISPAGETTALPAGHPPVGETTMPVGQPQAAASSLAWTTPTRWQKAPNTSSMRLATFRIPHAPGDSEDPEMAVMQAGGALEANIDRWIGQFADDGSRTTRRSTKKVGALAVTIVEIEGTYAGGMGMGKEKAAEKSWALLGAIAETPGMPHFFKMTGPVKSVKAARPELDALVQSLRAEP